MCTQRYLLIFVWFLSCLLSITSIQCKRHRRSMDQHYLHQQTHPVSHKYPFKILSFQNQKFNLPKLKIDSRSDLYSTSKVKLNSSFINKSANSVTPLTIQNWPQYLDNFSLTVLKKNKNIKKTMNISTDLDNVPILSRNNGNEDKDLIFAKNGEKIKAPKNLIKIHKWYKIINSTEDGNPESYNNSLQSENIKMLDNNRSKIQKEESSAFVSTDRTLKESDDNSKILLRVKRFANGDFLTNNDEPEKKSLLNLEGPSLLEDFESIKDQDNSLHIRVKRDNPNKTNIVPRFKSNYLDDLAASFPKSQHELEDERLTFNQIENDKLFKRSSDQEYNDNINNPGDVELNENFKRRDERFDSSNEKSPLDSDLEDQALEHKKRRKNYVKGHPELYSMKDEVALSVSKIANEYQKKNLGEDTSYEYANDNQDDLQSPFREDNKLIDSILSKMDYVVESGDLEKVNQRNDQNCASKTRHDSNNLYSSEVLQPAQQNEANSNKKSALRDKRKIKKHNKKKFKKKKSKKKHKKKKGRRHRKGFE